MAKKEFTKQELLELLNQHQVDGKLSFNSLGEIIFDSKFPDTLFSNAKDQIIKAREDEQRFKDLGVILVKKTQEALEKQKKVVALNDNISNNVQTISDLKKQIENIENELIPLENDFWEIKKRIDERKGE